MNKIIDSLADSPKKLFAIDGLGALLSAFLLGVVLTYYQSHFGMPLKSLYLLASIPVFFAFYDLCCLFMAREGWRPLMRGIAVMNLLYCLLSLSLAIHHRASLTALGWVYFLLEIALVVGLVIIEWKVSAK